MSYFLFLDDERVPDDVYWVKLPQEQWIIVRSKQDFEQTIADRGVPTFVSFDHDLGNDNGVPLPTGMDCAKYLVDACLDNGWRLPAFEVHSKNGPGGENIRGLLSSFASHQSRSPRP